MYVHLALNTKLIGRIASTCGSCNCSPNVCGSSIKAYRHDFVQYPHCKKIPYFIVRTLR